MWYRFGWHLGRIIYSNGCGGYKLKDRVIRRDLISRTFVIERTMGIVDDVVEDDEVRYSKACINLLLIIIMICIFIFIFIVLS